MSELATTPARWPERRSIAGTRVTLVPLSAQDHAAPLFAEIQGHPDLWQYMFDGPFEDEESLRQNFALREVKTDPAFYAVLENTTARVIGTASYLRIEPVHRVIEVGNILFSPRLQRTTAATETMYLMANYAFEELGYRRYEWKCNALNGPSRRAAKRLGFTFEGIFRQHMIVKGESRDTAWFAMLDSEWPACKRAFLQWLRADNFDAHDRQKCSLESFRETG